MMPDQDAKIASRRAKNRESQRRHRESLKTKLAELDALKSISNVLLPLKPSIAHELATQEPKGQHYSPRSPTPPPPASSAQSPLSTSWSTAWPHLQWQNTAPRCFSCTCSQTSPHQPSMQSELSIPATATYISEACLPSTADQVMQELEVPFEPISEPLDPAGSPPDATSVSQRPPGKPAEAAAETSSSALHLAVKGGNISCVKVLLINAARMNALDEDGMSPLHLCAVAERNSPVHADISKLLVAYGADTTIKNLQGQTPLQLAAGTGNDIVLQALVDAGIDVNQ